MKNDPFFKIIAIGIFAGAALAMVGPRVHAAIPLPAVHVFAQAPEWQRNLKRPAVLAPSISLDISAAIPALRAPAMPAPQPVDLPLGL
jgi:hypothetical protein